MNSWMDFSSCSVISFNAAFLSFFSESLYFFVMIKPPYFSDNYSMQEIRRDKKSMEEMSEIVELLRTILIVQL